MPSAPRSTSSRNEEELAALSASSHPLPLPYSKKDKNNIEVYNSEYVSADYLVVDKYIVYILLWFNHPKVGTFMLFYSPV